MKTQPVLAQLNLKILAKNSRKYLPLSDEIGSI